MKKLIEESSPVEKIIPCICSLLGVSILSGSMETIIEALHVLNLFSVQYKDSDSNLKEIYDNVFVFLDKLKPLEE